MNLRRRTGSHGRGGARLAYRTPIAASLATACLLGSVLGAQPAAAQSIFDRENHAAAASYAVHHLGADPKYGNWESGVNTYTAVGASAANRYARLPADRALPATIANKWTAMADFVTQVTGYNPRIPRDLATLNAAVHDYSFLLDQHAPNFPALKALFDTLEYRQVAVVHGHDELRRRLLFNCARCAREVVIISVLTSAGGLAGLGFNGQSTSKIVSVSVGGGVGFVVGAVLGILANRDLYRADRAARLSLEAQRITARIGTAALAAVAQFEQRATQIEQQQHVDRQQFRRMARDQESLVEQDSTFMGRITRLVRGA